MKKWKKPELVRHGSFESMTRADRTKTLGLTDGFIFNGNAICEPGVNCRPSVS